jgi:neutral ceramidase
VQVQFWGAHPNNSLQGRDTTLLTVEKLENGQWNPIRYDWDPDTFYQWKRDGIANSQITITWMTDGNLAAGRYRLCHRGHAKQILTGALKSYAGCSRAFEVTPAGVTRRSAQK